MLNADQMEQHGARLASAHRVTPDRLPDQLLSRLAASEGVRIETCHVLTTAVAANHRITPAGEWLLHNFYLVEEQIRTVRRLDRLVEYRTEDIFDPLRVVNPTYRHLDGQVRSLTGKLTRRLAQFAAMTLEETIEPEHVEPFVRRKAALQDEIETLQRELDTLKAKRKQTPHHLPLDALPEEARFRQLSSQSKQLIDTIKMIAYRGETAMANSLREHLTRPDEARRLLRALYTSEADLLPDPDAGTLTVRLHHGANAASDQAIEKLCEELNATETVFPRTNLRLVHLRPIIATFSESLAGQMPGALSPEGPPPFKRAQHRRWPTSGSPEGSPPAGPGRCCGA